MKKIVDIHKTNEDLSEQLMKKVDQCKGQEDKITKLEQEALEIKSAKE